MRLGCDLGNGNGELLLLQHMFVIISIDVTLQARVHQTVLQNLRYLVL